MKNFYIISLKFAPGLKKEFMVLGENIRKKGVNVFYLINEKYSLIEGNLKNVYYFDFKDGIKNMAFETLKFFNCKKLAMIFHKNPPDFILFYNPHPLNPRIASFIKKEFPYTKLCLFLHDPYKPDKAPYGFKKGLYISIAEFFQSLTVKYMDYVLSPSEFSSQLFKIRFPEFKGKNYITPLLIPDGKISNKERVYFSIVGGAHNATGHDDFIKLVNYVACYKLDYRFALVSSSNIDKYTKNLAEDGKKILNIVNKKIITEKEINEIISKSYAVFRLDREVTQSGVIPVAYMNSTPVIVRNIPGLKQHVKHKETGYIVPFNCKSEDLIKAMNFIKENFDYLSKNARKYYEEIFSESNFEKYYHWLIAPHSHTSGV